jgi:2-methylcitrate dehydratase PrpD
MIAALVALAEARQAGWPRLIEAVSVAYDILCLMADQSETRKNGFDPATLVPIAVAAGGAWLIGLDPTKTGNALRLAALDAGVLRCIRLGKIADWRAVAAARNAVKGLFAIEMAALGTEGPPGTFEADDGFFAHISGGLGLDEQPASRVGKAITKSYPAQIFIQPMLDLAAELHAELGARGRDITNVVVGTNSEAIRMIGPRPGHHTLNRETADHSAGFCTAAMLLTGRFGPNDLDDHLRSSAVLALAEKVTLAVEDGSDFPRKLPASVTVTLADGTQLSRRYDAPRPPDAASLRRKLDGLWPADRPRDWAWELPGERPAFPGS